MIQKVLARMHGHFRTCNGVLSTRSCYNFLKIARVSVSYLFPYWCLCLCPCILGYWLQQIVPTLDHFVLLGEFGAFNLGKEKISVIYVWKGTLVLTNSAFAKRGTLSSFSVFL